MTIYFTAGGLLGSAWVNTLQLVVMLVGFALALPFALQRVGGLGALPGAGAPAVVQRPHLLGRARVRAGRCSSLTRPGVHHLARADPEVVRRAQRSARCAPASRSTPASLLLFAFVPGAARHGRARGDARHRGSERGAADGADASCCRRGSARSRWPRCSPPKSTPATPSCSCSRRRRRRTSTSASSSPDATDAQLLRVGARRGGRRRRRSACCWRSCLQTVIGALTIFYSLLVVTLFVPVLGGLYSRRAGSAARRWRRSPPASSTLFVVRFGVAGALSAGSTRRWPGIVAAAAIAFFGVLTLRATRRAARPI